MRVLVFGLVLFLAVALAPQALATHTVSVDDDGKQCPGALTTIQAGVVAADAGSTIIVCRGTYHEMVVPKSNLRIVSKGGPRRVIVDADNKFAGFDLNGVTGVVIKGFGVREGFEGNIYLRNDANGNRIRGNVVTGPSGHDGIRLDDAHNNVITHNVAIDNGTPVNGCGIDLLLGSSGNIIHGNFVTLNDRAGIRLGAPMLGGQPAGAGVGNVVSHNVAVNNARQGILNELTNGTLILGNRTDRSPGAALAAGGTELGHGIRLVNSSSVVVWGNHSRRNARDGILAESTATGNTIVHNRAHDNGPPPTGWDCHDMSTGSGTANTANYWIENIGETDSPDGICKPHEEDDDDGDGGKEDD
jgi:parallel beta-helix repeat protein